MTTAAGTDVLLIVIELLRDCHVAFGFDRTIFGEFLPATSLSGVGEFTLGFVIVRPNVLYWGPVGDGGIGLSVMLLLRFVFDAVDMLNGRLVSDNPVDDFEMGECAAGLVSGFADTVTGVTVTDEFMILRGKVGDGVADVLAIEWHTFGFAVICCGAFGDVRRWFCCCRTTNGDEYKVNYI